MHIISPPPTFEPAVFSLTVHPRNPATVYAGTIAGVFQTTDGGEHWSALLSKPWLGFTRSTVSIDPQTPTTLYAAALFVGIFRSTDGGGSWTPLNTGLTDLVFTTPVQVSPSGVCLHVGTQSGVFDFATRSDPCAPLVNLVAAILPSRRSAQVRAPVTAFATVINAGDKPAVDVGISLVQFSGSVSATLTYQATDPQTNAVIGLPNTPADHPLAAHGPRVPRAPAVGNAAPGSVFMKRATSRCAAFPWPLGNALGLSNDLVPAASVGLGEQGNPVAAGSTGRRVRAGDEIRALASDPVTPTCFSAGTQGSDVFDTIDDAGSWSAVNFGLTDLHVDAFQRGGFGRSPPYGPTPQETDVRNGQVLMRRKVCPDGRC
jgi:hypothetical protein